MSTKVPAHVHATASSTPVAPVHTTASRAATPTPTPVVSMEVEEEPVMEVEEEEEEEEDEAKTPPSSERAFAEQAPRAKPEYEDADLVSVTFGYGLNDLSSQRFFVEDIPFTRERIARNVPFKRARALQKVYRHGVVRVHANDATEAQIAKNCGIRPGDPKKVAAMLLASDLDEIARQMNPEELAYLARKLSEKAVAAKHGLT